MLAWYGTFIVCIQLEVILALSQLKEGFSDTCSLVSAQTPSLKYINKNHWLRQTTWFRPYLLNASKSDPFWIGKKPASSFPLSSLLFQALAPGVPGICDHLASIAACSIVGIGRPCVTQLQNWGCEGLKTLRFLRNFLTQHPLKYACLESRWTSCTIQSRLGLLYHSVLR